MLYKQQRIERLEAIRKQCLLLQNRIKKEFVESEHPRDNDGKFTSGGSGSKEVSSSEGSSSAVTTALKWASTALTVGLVAATLAPLAGAAGVGGAAFMAARGSFIASTALKMVGSSPANAGVLVALETLGKNIDLFKPAVALAGLKLIVGGLISLREKEVTKAKVDPVLAHLKAWKTQLDNYKLPKSGK